MVFGLESMVMMVVFYVVAAAELWALIDAAVRPTRAYVAADKLTKPAWLVILGLALATNVFIGSIILTLAGLVAACVYLLDVRPALSSVTRRR
ncbi:MAG TPA: DUF2516 family protein [Marmoricola sp.]|nr:DUF2516 family protein [Marmoricola sp.]